ncbi:PadR family transcriptional regulator [Streptomyces sp. TRM43335]|uniref:PadR family transcriptional regulator n=1 Tax=Streptomyces taklimakanensis TaxID=2569853 RepID=A0A6G2BGD0_9ACTN|nr:helix-turn-helix transcriptional regulator [Streptomyces taklimakanensis]MTE20962.1 PadR family transcriptional regulator [Streptomyces taklimakanensis]
MPPVFAHGRLRLYLLKLLSEAPRHGYEVIRLLEERFQGLYAPSAGTVYPRLAKLEAEGLVRHTTEGGRKVYSLTDAGREELTDRHEELTELEREIHESLAALAADIREDVSGAAGDLRREVREEARRNRGTGDGDPFSGWEAAFQGPWADKEAVRAAKEELRRAGEQWREQARRARQEAQQARLQAHQARRARDEARQEAQRIARQVQEQVQSRARQGDWQGAVRAGMSELSRHLGALGGLGEPAGRGGSGTPGGGEGASGPGRDADRAAPRPPYARPEGPVPGWAEEPAEPSGDPLRDLERLLDGFRDDVRDAARDHGVGEEELREARHHLAAAATHLVTMLRSRTEE